MLFVLSHQRLWVLNGECLVPNDLSPALSLSQRLNRLPVVFESESEIRRLEEMAWRDQRSVEREEKTKKFSLKKFSLGRRKQ